MDRVWQATVHSVTESDTTKHQHWPGSGCLLNIISPQWGGIIPKDTVQEKKENKKPSSN